MLVFKKDRGSALASVVQAEGVNSAFYGLFLYALRITNHADVFLCPTAILSELLQRENRVLHFWTLKKRRLDQCQQYVVFERSAKQVV